MNRSSLVPPLNLIWRRDTIGRVVEASFIKDVLLGALDRPVRARIAANLKKAFPQYFR